MTEEQAEEQRILDEDTIVILQRELQRLRVENLGLRREIERLHEITSKRGGYE